MRNAGVVVARVLSKLQKTAKPGISTGRLDAIASEMSIEAGAEMLFKGVRNPNAKIPFPGAICTSINEQIVHGIPSDDTILKEGDIISIDFGVRLKGYCADSAVTVAIGQVAEDRNKLVEATRRTLQVAIDNVAPGLKWSSIARKMQKYAESQGFYVVRDFVGHGIGTQMHAEPRVPNFVDDGVQADDFVLEEGMILDVEPMVNAGTWKARTLEDGWTVVTKDGKCSAHFEHTIAILKNGCEVLTIESI